MKPAVKAISVTGISLAVCVVLVVTILSRTDSSVKQEEPGIDRPQLLLVADGNSWPMFRGGPKLPGRASGALPDSLDLVWKFKTHGKIESSPAIEHGLVFIGSDDANTYAIDLVKGHKVWEYRTGGAVEAAPCVVDGVVFVGSSDGFLYAIDANSGAFKWKYETDAEILGAANWARSADAQGTWILVGSYDGKLHCVDAGNGDVVWAYETDNYVNGAPAIGEGKAVFGGCDAAVHVVSLADGNEISQIDTGYYIAASVAISEGHLYVGNYEGLFVRADIATGQVVWKYEESDEPYFSSAAVGEDVVVVGGRDNHVHCIRRSDKKVVWKFKTLGEVDSSPVICGDKVVVGSEDGRLYMIRLSDGEQVWFYEIGQPVTSSPAVAGGAVVVGSDDGYVYAFGRKR
jgi:outer membrane protein assembly factor BamB